MTIFLDFLYIDGLLSARFSFYVLFLCNGNTYNLRLSVCPTW